LAGYSGFVQDSGEGRWTVQAAIDEAVPAEVLTAALYARFRSRQEHTFAEKDAFRDARRASAAMSSRARPSKAKRHATTPLARIR
jgi:6-phosphogluconate dehydrogenase (decarboxylating)